MRLLPLTLMILTLFILFSCNSSHADSEFNRLRSKDADRQTIVYEYATYLSTSKSISPDEAIPMISEMISLGYPAEARYCINNLKGNGIHSYDLLALRGLCYMNELQPELALIDLELALAWNPGNVKIISLLNQAKGKKNPGIPLQELLDKAGKMMVYKQYDELDSALDVILQQDNASHRALYFKGMIRLMREQYDSALYYMTFARSSENLEEYGQYILKIDIIMEGEKLIVANPVSIEGYIHKSQGLASMGMFDSAQETLDKALVHIPDNVNLILAKALVWVQARQPEIAEQYLWEQERRGIAIDPSLKEKILQKHQ